MKCRSTKIALRHLVAKVEEQMENKDYELAAFLDIEGVFDCINCHAIERVMSIRGFLETIIGWIQHAGRVIPNGKAQWDAAGWRDCDTYWFFGTNFS